MLPIILPITHHTSTSPCPLWTFPETPLVTGGKESSISFSVHSSSWGFSLGACSAGGVLKDVDSSPFTRPLDPEGWGDLSKSSSKGIGSLTPPSSLGRRCSKWWSSWILSLQKGLGLLRWRQWWRSANWFHCELKSKRTLSWAHNS